MKKSTKLVMTLVASTVLFAGVSSPNLAFAGKASEYYKNVPDEVTFEVDARDLSPEMQKAIGYNPNTNSFNQDSNNLARVYKPKVQYVHWNKATLEKMFKKKLGKIPTVSSGYAVVDWALATLISVGAPFVAGAFGFSVAIAKTALKQQKATFSKAIAMTKKGKAKGIKWKLTPNPNSYPKVKVSMSVWK
ncbi:TPA_asm: hypothetical protein GJA98_14890 [Listeria monocytogenes]|nr:hypothetical protein [Listeria monocytogenes]